MKQDNLVLTPVVGAEVGAGVINTLHPTRFPPHSHPGALLHSFERVKDSQLLGGFGDGGFDVGGPGTGVGAGICPSTQLPFRH